MCPKHPRDNISSFHTASNQLAAAASQSHAQASVQPAPTAAPARTLSMSSWSAATTVPTDRPRPGKVIIDTKNLNEQDLKTIKKCDPFLYYSIPFVRDAEVNRSGEFPIPLHDQACTQIGARIALRLPQTRRTTSKQVSSMRGLERIVLVALLIGLAAGSKWDRPAFDDSIPSGVLGHLNAFDA